MPIQYLFNKLWGLFALLVLQAGMPVFAGKPYAYFPMGDPAARVTAKPFSSSPSIVLMGGGYDVAEAFRWMIDRAGVSPGTGGRFVVIRATGDDAYNPYIFSKLHTTDLSSTRSYDNVGGADKGLSSVETLVIPSRTAASDPFVIDVMSRASAIWIAGGDQSDYFTHWKGTPLEAALQAAIQKGIPVGGTSAGTAMLGQYAFVALKGSVTSAQALGDPFHRAVTIDPLNTGTKRVPDPAQFVSIGGLSQVITDQHLNTRDRLGRLVAFVARIGNGCPQGPLPYNAVHGIGIDEETALLISTDADGHTRARMAVNPLNTENFVESSYTRANSVYFVRMAGAPSVCAEKRPLFITHGGVMIHRMSDPSPRLPAGSKPYSSYLPNNVFHVDLWKSGAVMNLGTNVSAPLYYGTGGGALQFGPLPF